MLVGRMGKGEGWNTSIALTTIVQHTLTDAWKKKQLHLLSSDLFYHCHRKKVWEVEGNAHTSSQWPHPSFSVLLFKKSKTNKQKNKTPLQTNKSPLPPLRDIFLSLPSTPWPCLWLFLSAWIISSLSPSFPILLLAFLPLCDWVF